MSESKYSVDTDGNQIIINGELVLTLHVDTPDGETVEPDKYEWLDDGAFGLYDRPSEAGVQVQMADRSLRGDADE